MTIEASQYINQLNTAFPRSTDLLKEGDDHIRLIKANLKNTFPNITNSISISSDTLNYLNNAIKVSPSGIVFTNSISLSGGAGVNLSSTEVSVGNARGEVSQFQDAAAINWATMRAIFRAMYPVNSVFCTGNNNAAPDTLPMFRGTSWTPFGNGRYMLSAGNGGDNGPWGFGLGAAGTAGFSIGYGNMPQHTHTVPDHSHHVNINTSTNGAHAHQMPTDSVGGGNMAALTYTDKSDENFANWTTTNGDHLHNVNGDTGGVQGGRTTGGVDQGSGSSPISYTPAFTSAFYWRRVT